MVATIWSLIGFPCKYFFIITQLKKIVKRWVVHFHFSFKTIGFQMKIDMVPLSFWLLEWFWVPKMVLFPVDTSHRPSSSETNFRKACIQRFAFIIQRRSLKSNFRLNVPRDLLIKITCKIIPAVPTKTATVNIHRKSRSSTMATYFQSSMTLKRKIPNSLSKSFWLGFDGGFPQHLEYIKPKKLGIYLYIFLLWIIDQRKNG